MSCFWTGFACAAAGFFLGVFVMALVRVGAAGEVISGDAGQRKD